LAEDDKTISKTQMYRALRIKEHQIICF